MGSSRDCVLCVAQNFPSNISLTTCILLLSYIVSTWSHWTQIKKGYRNIKHTRWQISLFFSFFFRTKQNNTDTNNSLSVSRSDSQVNTFSFPLLCEPWKSHHICIRRNMLCVCVCVWDAEHHSSDAQIQVLCGLSQKHHHKKRAFLPLFKHPLLLFSWKIMYVFLKLDIWSLQHFCCFSEDLIH